MQIIEMILDIYMFILLAHVVISWLTLPANNSVVDFIYKVTEPVLEPIRSILPTFGGLDFSPLIVLFGIQIFKSVIF
jgi:YggT family protein